jgi:DnaJ-class molecular chaperone
MTTKYEVNDMLYYIDTAGIYEKIPCPKCGGYGYLIIPSDPQKTTNCDKCNNKGVVNGDWCGAKWVPSIESKIMVGIHIGSYNSEITYEDNYENFYREEDVFLDLAEAQAECDRRNGVL